MIVFLGLKKVAVKVELEKQWLAFYSWYWKCAVNVAYSKKKKKKKKVAGKKGRLNAAFIHAFLKIFF